MYNITEQYRKEAVKEKDVKLESDPVRTSTEVTVKAEEQQRVTTEDRIEKQIQPDSIDKIVAQAQKVKPPRHELVDR